MTLSPASPSPQKPSALQRARRNLSRMSLAEGLLLFLKVIPLLVFLCLGFYLLWVGDRLDQMRIARDKDSVRVIAQVTDKRFNPDSDPSIKIKSLQSNWLLILKFKTLEGKTVGPLSIKCSDRMSKDIEPGDQVAIRYLKAYPSRFSIAGNNFGLPLIAQLRIFSLSIVILAMFAILFIAACICREDDKSILLKLLKALFRRRTT